jgi:hypothetical protein
MTLESSRRPWRQATVKRQERATMRAVQVAEPNGPPFGTLDVLAVDIHTISPAQWETIKREIARRAHAERAKVMRDLARRLRFWWQRRSGATLSSGAARTLGS